VEPVDARIECLLEVVAEDVLDVSAEGEVEVRDAVEDERIDDGLFDWDALLIMLGVLLEGLVVVAVRLLLPSSPQTPLSQGSVEQHPVKGPLAQR
jgi:hypothetical protein